MPVNYHQPSVTALFDAMPAPMLTFGVSGQVTSANSAARNHPGNPVQAMNGAGTIKALIADITLGKIKIPYRASIEVMNGLQLHGQFMAGPAGLDVAFVADMDAAQAGVQAPALKLKDVMALLRAELLPPVAKFDTTLQALSQTLIEGSVAAEQTDALQRTGQALGMRLKRLSDLVDVFGDEVALAHDRIEILPLMQMVCTKLDTKAQSLGVYFEIQPPEQTLPPLYGNAKLIERALSECLDNAITHSRQEVTAKQKLAVHIQFTLSGEHVLISVRNKGATALRIGKEEIPPFPAQKTMPSTPVPTAPAAPAPRLGLALVQRIVSLHGGAMRIKSSDSDVHVLLEFPTGAPNRGQQHLDMAQAQRYAADLAQLMSRRKKESV